MTEKPERVNGTVSADRIAERLPPEAYHPTPTHRRCVDCGKRFPEDDMISDNRARWRCWPCARKLLGEGS